MTTSPFGRSLELYFIDGKPDGMLTAEVFNWTGHVLMTPRIQLAKALSRPVAQFTGVYLLLGEVEDTSRIYIGESENVADRIRNHDQKKEWWTTAVMITTGANSLNKAYVKYLEARLIEIAAEVGRFELENATSPTRTGLSEAAQANMEAFIDYLLMVLPAIRVDAFVTGKRPSEPISSMTAHYGSNQPDNVNGPKFEFVVKKQGTGPKLRATARLVAGDFIVEAGSMAAKEWKQKATSGQGYRPLFEELKKIGVLAPSEQHSVFSVDYAFKSTSAAASIVSGTAARGPHAWKVVPDGRTYADWEAEQLGSPREL